MAFHRRNEELNMEQVAAFLKDAVQKVESNPEYYEELKKTFKKSVPLTRRSYVAAYLLKCASGSIFRFNSSTAKNREDFRSRREDSRRPRENFREESPKTFEQKERFQRVRIDPENAATVFVSIGRNRRVFPKDLVGLFAGQVGIDPAKIGNIRVLASYSFVELFKEDAEKAISTLNGFEYKGKKLAVSFSEKREDGLDAVPASFVEERVPTNVENVSAPIADSFTTTNSDTMAQQAAFAKEMEKKPVSEMSDEEIMALRAPRSSSSEDVQ